MRARQEQEPLLGAEGKQSSVEEKEQPNRSTSFANFQKIPSLLFRLTEKQKKEDAALRKLMPSLKDLVSESWFTNAIKLPLTCTAVLKKLTECKKHLLNEHSKAADYAVHKGTENGLLGCVSLLLCCAPSPISSLALPGFAKGLFGSCFAVAATSASGSLLKDIKKIDTAINKITTIDACLKHNVDPEEFEKSTGLHRSSSAPALFESMRTNESASLLRASPVR